MPMVATVLALVPWPARQKWCCNYLLSYHPRHVQLMQAFLVV